MTPSGQSDFLVRLGPPSRGDTIHRDSCSYARCAKGKRLRWRWADERGYADIDWDALRRHGIRACRHCIADLLREPTDAATTTPQLDFGVDPEIVKAIAWCRLGGLQYRPETDGAFHHAKALGLLAQDDIWRATERGEGVLVALGLLDGEPAPERRLVEMLWARSARFDRPQLVCAWPEGLSDCWPEEAARIRAKAEGWFRDFGDDGGWTFWTTFQHIEAPVAA